MNSGNSEATAPKVAIVLGLNDRFLPPAQALIESIRRHGGPLDGVTLVVLTTGLTASSAAAVENSAAKAGLPLAIRTISDLSALGSIPQWAVTTCLRLYTGDVCHDFRRALYLDSDMLVLDSLTPLIDLNLQGRTAAAVINHPPLNVLRVAIRRSQREGVDGNVPYFNAGVLLVDIDRWKIQSIGERSRAFLKHFPATRLLDQDALNMVLVNDWCQLDKEWNTPAGPLGDSPMLGGLVRMNPSILETIREWELAQKRPKILHFTGQPKPWETSYPWTDLKDSYQTFVLPEFGSVWPESRFEIANAKSQKAHGFRRV